MKTHEKALFSFALIMVSVFQIAAATADATNNQNNSQISESNLKPWTHPCIPSLNFEFVTEVNASTTPFSSINILLEKNRELKRLARRIQRRISFQIRDLSLIRSLWKRKIPGFPKSKLSKTQNSTTVYWNCFLDLSKAAVYLEQVYVDETHSKRKEIFRDIFGANLSQLCELQVNLLASNKLTPENIGRRNIMSAEQRQMKTNFDRYLRDYTIISNYRKLLKLHHRHYLRLNNKH